jgi:hypothetical protein
MTDTSLLGDIVETSFASCRAVNVFMLIQDSQSWIGLRFQAIENVSLSYFSPDVLRVPKRSGTIPGDYLNELRRCSASANKNRPSSVPRSSSLRTVAPLPRTTIFGVIGRLLKKRKTPGRPLNASRRQSILNRIIIALHRPKFVSRHA